MQSSPSGLHRPKRIVCFAPAAPQQTLQAALARRCAAAAAPEWTVCTKIEEVRRALGAKYVDALVLDLRCPGAPRSETLEQGFTLLEELDRTEDVEARYAFHRIVALVQDDDLVRGDRWVAELAAHGLGSVLRAHPQAETPSEFEDRVARGLEQLLTSHHRGKTALAASGGGITGIYFELGALKCLDDCLDQRVNDFDMYFGISAGAVVTGVIASGYSVSEFMAALAGHPGSRVPDLNLQLFRLGHLNFPDMKRRLFAGSELFWKALYSLVWRRRLPRAGELFLDYTALIGPPFRSDGFEGMLHEILSQPGATNDFRRLRKPLFIGATDQDLRNHVLFGSEGVDHIPISRAIQASLSVHPAFSSVAIESRYYEDGAVTRTSDFIEAIARGAKLVFVLDPFVPYVSHEPGAINRQGVLYNIDQDIRALSYTRFANTRSWVLRQHPEVSTYTFLPSNRVRRLLSANPMDHRPFLEIWRGAYISTFQRVKRLRHRMQGDLAAHGIRLDLTKAEAVAERLDWVVEPSFSDFFPDGEVVLDQPPLSEVTRSEGAPAASARRVAAVRKAV